MRSPPIENLGGVGVVADQPAWSLPPPAFTDARNVRFRDGAIETFEGQTSVFGIPPGNPYRVMPVANAGVYYWVYPDISKVWATDSETHADISPTVGVSASYSATDELLWNGGAFNGYMVLNNARQIPLTWFPNLSNRAEQMNVSGAWPTDLLADVIRSYRNYLIALRCSENGVYNERLMRWSNGSAVGQLPTSWDWTDETNDAGRVEFGQTQDRLIDCLPLRDINAVYKANTTWSMAWVGGNLNPFQMRLVFSQVGLLSEWCVAAFEGPSGVAMHCCLTTSDVMIHDLNAAHSIVDKKMRSWLFNRMDADAARHSFVVPNYSQREIWICYAESGHTFPNMALVWNWKEDTLQVRELGFDCPHIGWGIVQPIAGLTFDSLVGTFDEWAGAFDRQQFNPVMTSLLMADPSRPRLVEADSGSTFDGNVIRASAQREAFPIDTDIQRFKHIKRIYPKVLGPQGAILQLSLGRQAAVNDAVSWTPYKNFIVGTDRFINIELRSVIVSIRYATTDPLRVFGFELEYDQGGYY